MAQEAQALLLQVGQQRWCLLPDRQAWRAWRDGARAPSPLAGLWLGFSPDASTRWVLQRRQGSGPPARLWWLAAGSRSGWRQS